ncbi:hypothetical protein [Halapricum desulfuricans]|uniref:Uncharacterized protein n=1 Tax=Halapricum desulfuricans TaxID=2841257 RepID=A0A897NNC2_9EURY|nr:hypothetical protein [Halapricum desulfuricans]QSG13934.1 Uncharacterized protein HSEST_0385 [Halapricum desulfuricans]
MRRRRLLSALAGATVGLTGCLTSNENSTTSSKTPVGTQSTTPTQTDSPTETTTAEESDAVVPDDVSKPEQRDPNLDGPAMETRFKSASPPPLPDEERTVWYHEANSETPTFIKPSTEQVGLPATIDFTFYNLSETTVSGAGGSWSVYKLVDGTWYIVSGIWYPFAMNLPPSQRTDWSWSWSLDLSRGWADDSEDDPESPFVPRLGGGRYAFTGDWVDGINHGALFDIDAPPIELTPDDDVQVSHEGETVTVTMPEWTDDKHPEPETLTVEPIDRADERVIREQAATTRGFRNTLPFFEDGIKRVILRTDKHGVESVVGYENDDKRRRFRYLERAYRATIDRRD